MKTAQILSFAAAVLAAPAPVPAPAASSSPTKFGGLSIHSGNVNVHLHPINANGQAFWLNKNTTTYCPPSSGYPCPPKDSHQQTVFATANTGTLSMDTVVPGGQQVYVTPAGQLKFTQAHSANMGSGAISTGFSVVEGALKFEGKEWYACNANEGYGVYAASRTSNAAQCVGFRFKTLNDTTDRQTVWQYT